MEVIFYRTDTGSCPMINFLNSLPPILKARVLHDIDLLEEKGNRIGMPYSRSLGGGLYELRTQDTGNIARSFYFFYEQGNIIVTHGFIKKTQKTPPASAMSPRIPDSPMGSARSSTAASPSTPTQVKPIKLAPKPSAGKITLVSLVNSQVCFCFC